MKLKFRYISLVLMIMVLAGSGSVVAQQAPAPTQTPAQQASTPQANATAVANQIIDKFIQRENTLIERMANLHPLIETYIQNLNKDEELAFVPKSDTYFLSKLDLNNDQKQRSLMKKPGWFSALKKQATGLYSVQYLPEGFTQMLVMEKGFDRNNYTFEFVRREFLGEVRCLVFDVKPKPSTPGTFSGRIWVEDQDYNIIRFNGTNGKSTATKMFFHFDSWREFMGPGLWLPAYVYSEESDIGYALGQRKLRFKAQTRLWGYNIGRTTSQEELTALIVESDQVRDGADEANSTSPVEALREWERQAEDNIIQRLEKAGLIAPSGEVNQVLETVINNLVVTNDLNIAPEVRARVLMTSPLESFTIGHTIVLSRGLIDVLPDEASLAMILSHELAHIALGHQIDTKYAFNDRMLFDDVEALRMVALKRDEQEETEADQKAAEYLNKSPYKDKLGNAGLFLKAVNERAKQLPRLLLAHIGNTMVKDSSVRRMADLINTAPPLEMAKVEQIAALPLGGRVHVEPWSGKIELSKAKAVPIAFAREKMPFEVTPVFLYLTRQSSTQTVANQPAPQPTTPPAPQQ